MPILLACPSCGGKLRVSDELCGQRVRCPSCGHTFDAAPAAAPGPIGAMELKLSLDDDPPSPSSAPPPAEPPKRTAPPRLADEHDDLKTCPVCGKHVHRDSTRCFSCGERFDDGPPDEDVPSFRRRGPRRDAEPDRGAAVLALGIISLACLVISCVPVGAVLGLIAWMMGRTDLRKMKRGDMDANGQGITQAGWICGIIGTLLNGLITLACGSFIVIAIVSDMNPPRTSRSYVAPPPPVRQFPPPKQVRPRQKF
jgi:predicted Zn finger-like uncharacterized protein